MMPRKKKPKPAAKRSPARRRPGVRSERREATDLEGPPPREATIVTTNEERQAEARQALHTATSPRLTGGDLDADWPRAASVGEEAVGGTVATPDQSNVDALGEALGVPRAPDEEVRTSGEILERRDRRRAEQEG
jgi:hypothetical protein